MLFWAQCRRLRKRCRHGIRRLGRRGQARDENRHLHSDRDLPAPEPGCAGRAARRRLSATAFASHHRVRPLRRGLPRRRAAPWRGVFFLDDGCLGCGRCAAVCPMGAIAVTGFALRPSEIKVTHPLTLDCWRVPTEASPSRSVRVPCLGGLSPGQWLGLVLAARGDAPGTASPAPPKRAACACCGPGVELLDRGWCGACPANPGATHPAAAALAVVHGWLKEARIPRQHWPRLVRAPLPAARAVTPDPRNETPVNRRNFFGALVHESVDLATTALSAPRAEERHKKSDAGRRRGRKTPGADRRTQAESMAAARTPVASLERGRVLVFLAALAARHGGGVPAALYPTITIGAGCRHHRLCAALCPTGALYPTLTTTAWESRMTRPIASPAASARRPARNTPSVCNPPVPERTRSLRSLATPPARARRAASASPPTAARRTVRRAASRVTSPAPAS